MVHSDVRVEKIGIVDIYKIKYSARRYYIIVPRKLIEQYDLNSGHFLKIHIKEVRKPVVEAAEP